MSMAPGLDWRNAALNGVPPGAIVTTNEVEANVIRSNDLPILPGQLYWKDYERLRRELNRLAVEGLLAKGKQGKHNTWSRVA